LPDATTVACCKAKIDFYDTEHAGNIHSERSIIALAKRRAQNSICKLKILISYSCQLISSGGGIKNNDSDELVYLCSK